MIPTGHILVKSSKGKRTHNGKRTWRLWSDGTVQRTSSHSKYQQPFTDELVPQTIREVAHQHGITLTGFRERDPLARRTS